MDNYFLFGDVVQWFDEKYANDSIYDIIQEIAPNLEDSMFACKWQDRFVPCSQLVVPILTENGLCFTFNAINSHEIYSDEYVFHN